jgi:UDP-N-acetylglucosamine 2-epimerase
MDGIHVFLGTKAQYVKTAPLVRLLDDRGVAYRLIDTGQHARLSAGLRTELGVRAPDYVLGDASDVESVPQAAGWALSIARRLGDPEGLRREVFGGDGGICVVHGDTPSTVLATLLARRAGLRVAHLEAGLRSHNLLHPFPEEAIRLVVMRLAALLFAPDATAVANLRALRVRGRVVAVPGNTSIDALRAALDPDLPLGAGPAVVTMHRVENLHRRRRVHELAEVVERIALRRPVRVVVHGPTKAVLARAGIDQRLLDAGVELVPLVPYGEFVAMLAAAPFVITDGGSVQEECALLGVPTLLWRARTERPDGLGANVVLSRYDPDVVGAFLAAPERHRRPPAPLDARPTAAILAVLLDELARGRGPEARRPGP